VERFSNDSEFMDAVSSLLDDYLKLPEGKLVSSKTKMSCLSWLRSLESKMYAIDDAIDIACSQSQRYVVADINDDDTLLLMSPDPNCTDFVEDMTVDPIILADIRNQFNADGGARTIYVDVDQSTNSVIGYAVQPFAEEVMTSSDVH
jgi:hypothetical protein